jgi:hypothetical protein
MQIKKHNITNGSLNLSKQEMLRFKENFVLGCTGCFINLGKLNLFTVVQFLAGANFCCLKI